MRLALLEITFFLVFTPQTLRAVGVLFSPMVSGWTGVQEGRWVVNRKKSVQAVSQKT